MIRPALSASQVRLAYADQLVLDGIDLQCQQGQFTALLGPSGCGKSTLLRLFAGLRSPSAGAVEFENAGSERVGFVFQDPTLLPWRTVAQNVELPLQLARTPRTDLATRIADALQLVGLAATDASKYPRELSGGMRMRVSLARTLVTSPSVMLLDEPFAALDEILRQQLNEELSRLWQQHQWTTLFVTHNVVEAVFLSQRIAILTPQPARIATIVEVPFAYPRAAELRGTTEFAKLVGEVSSILREHRS